MTDPISEDAIDQLFVEYLKTAKPTRTAGQTRRRSTTKLPRPEWMPEARSVRVTPRGAPQTSWWRAQRIAEDSLVVRQATQGELLAHEGLRSPERIAEEVLGRNFKTQPGQAEEEKKRDILQKIHGVWL